MKKSKVDALIIGSGVGGLCAAARLVEQGMKVLVIERLSYLGGRFSSKEIKGFQVTTGAIMVPFGDRSAFQETFDMMGASFQVREARGGFRYRLRHGEYEVPPEGGGGLMGMLQFALGDAAAAKELFGHFKQALAWWEPADSISFKEWLSQYTRHEEVHNLLQGFVAAFIGVSLDELPAGEYFRFLKAMGRNSRYGIAANGNRELMESLTAAVESKGSEVRTKTACKGILVDQGRARGALIEHQGEEETVEADIVISNTGPEMTVRLAGATNFEESYLTLLKIHPHPTPVVHVSIASREPLHEFPGIFNFGNTRNMIFMECPSLSCPELAPEGKHLTTTFSVFASSADTRKRKETIEAVMLDLKDNFPSFEKDAEPLVVTAHHGQWPAMRRWPGYPMPVRTPIENLYNVGDGCMPLGTVGIEAAALSAKFAVRDISGRR